MEASELKERIPLAVVLRHYGWNSKRWGQKTLCPFHADTDPSAMIKGDRFYCFVCDARGDIIDLVQQREGMNFKGAVDWLENRFC